MRTAKRNVNEKREEKNIAFCVCNKSRKFNKFHISFHFIRMQSKPIQHRLALAWNRQIETNVISSIHNWSSVLL